LTPVQAWRDVEQWLDAPQVWVREAGERTARILGDLVMRLGVTGNLLSDGQLAAVAIEHGIPVVSADSGFARFSEVAWINPVA
jgi:predicted nucleic acid-binding protein